MRFKPDWSRARERFDAWWAGTTDRPILQVTALKKEVSVDTVWNGWGLMKEYGKIRENVSAFLDACRQTHFAGDAFPSFWNNLGPGIMAAFIGARPEVGEDTVWFETPMTWDQVDREVAAYLAGHTTPDECVLVWGYEPLIYFLAGRAACTRYIFDYPLTSQYAPDSWLEGARATFLAEIEDRPPAYIAVAHGDVNPLESEDSARQLAAFTQLARIVEQNYCLETTIGRFEILSRCPGER